MFVRGNAREGDGSESAASKVVGAEIVGRTVDEHDRIVVGRGAGVPIAGGAPVAVAAKSRPSADCGFNVRRQTKKQGGISDKEDWSFAPHFPFLWSRSQFCGAKV